MPVRDLRRRRLTSNTLRRVFDAIPGKKALGVYRFLPLFFLMGAALEFSMINWTVGETNFCKGIEFNVAFDKYDKFELASDTVYKKRQATNQVESEAVQE